MLEEKLVKTVSAILLGLTIVICSLLFYLSASGRGFERIFEWSFDGLPQWLVVSEKEDTESVGKLIETERLKDEQLEEQLARQEESARERISISLPKGTDAAEVTLNWDYMKRSLRLFIPEADSEGTADMDESILSGRRDFVSAVSFEKADGGTYLEITTDKVYEFECNYTTDKIYIKPVELHEVYDYVVVIDPGHGGEDPGTVDTGYNEKDINLAIAMKLKARLSDSDFNFGVFLTRTQNENPKLSERSALLESAGADAFISIHSSLSEEENSAEAAGVLELKKSTLFDDSDEHFTVFEAGSMKDSADLKKLVKDEYQDEIARTLYERISGWAEEQTATQQTATQQTAAQ